MKVNELLGKVDKIVPFALAMEWDNVGLMVGDEDAVVSRVGVALDPTSEAVVAAAEQGCQALLCHHPLFFHPIKKLELNADPGRAVREAVCRGVAVLAAHTNWDCAEQGVNATLAALLGLQDVSRLDAGTGLGTKGLLPESLSLDVLLQKIKEAWGLTRLDGYFPHDRRVSRVALCGGSGGGFWREAKAWDADLYVTADIKYHELLDASRAGLAVAVADHGEMERASLPELVRLLRDGGVDAVRLDVKGLSQPVRI